MIPVEWLETVDSTSDELKRRVEAGFAGELCLVAGSQTGGRGRLGRVWRSPPGNFYGSVLLRPERWRSPGHWSLLAAVAAAEACGPETRLKWPNDVLLRGGKLAGVLLEAGGGARPWLVIGVGVNLLAAPEGLGRSLAALGPGAPTPFDFARLLLDRLDLWRGRYEREGFAPVRDAWLARGHALGERIVATVGAGSAEGWFAGLTAEGALLLDTGRERLVVSSGEVA